MEHNALTYFKFWIMFTFNSIGCQYFNTSYFINNYEQEDIEDTAKCVLQLSAKYLVDKNILKGNIVIVNIHSADSLSSENILKTIHHGNEYSIMVKDSSFKHKNASHFPEKAKNYLMILDTKEALIKNIDQLRVLPTWNPLAKAVVYIRKRPEYEVDSLVKELSDKLKEYQLLSSIILIDIEEDDEMKAFYCKYYSEKNCAGPCDSIYLLDICTSKEVIHYSNYTDIIPHDMKKCPLFVYATISEPYILYLRGRGEPIYTDQYKNIFGIEIKLLQLITNITNMTLIVNMISSSEDRGELYKNGTATGLYAKVRYDTADVIVGNLAVDEIKRKWLDVTHSYKQDVITWCIQLSGTTSTWYNLITIFTFSTWLSTIAVVALVSFIFLWFHYQETPHKTLGSSTSLMSAFGMILGLVMAIKPKGSAHRIVMISWLLFSLNLNTSYQSQLLSFLIHPTYADQIDSEAKLEASDVKLGGKPWIREAFYNNTIIYDKFEICSTLRACVYKIKMNSKFAVAASYEQIQFHEKFLGRGESFTYCFTDSNIIYKYDVVALTRKHFPLLPRFDDIINAVRESGLIEKWIDDVMPADKFKNKNEIFPLGLSHMLGAFYALAIGQGISGIVLVMEIFYQKYMRHVNYRKHFKPFYFVH